LLDSVINFSRNASRRHEVEKMTTKAGEIATRVSPTLAVTLLLAILMPIVVSMAGDAEVLSPPFDVSLPNPAADALESLSDESFHSTHGGDVQLAALLLGDGKLHVPDTGESLSQTAYAACLTRSPPLA
jgi:hypothetical protein